ncbi:MAG: zinc-binding dehydrogenase [Gemmatimonadota bacterium]
MKAAIFHGAHRALTVEDVPKPSPEPGQVLIRVAGCGVCHTDLHYLDHGTPTFKEPPLILGHEISGVVEETGEGVDAPEVGTPVVVAAVTSCGRCRACREGRENICARGEMLGNNVDGGFAEYVVAPAKDVFPLPEELPLVESSIIADALTTPYHAVVNRGRVSPGDRVVVFGCGGVGLNVVQMAAARGAYVVAVDIAPRKLEWAAELGAHATLDSSAEERPDKALRRLTGGGADVAFEVVGVPETQKLALGALRTGGKAVFVGYNPDPVTLNSGRIMFRELEVVGSLGCRPVDYPRVIEMVRQGQVHLDSLVTHRFALDDIGEALDTLRSGEAIRVVVTP